LDLEFRVLGPLEVLRGKQGLPLGSPKQRALLGLFLVHANEPIPRERLIEELWGDAAPKTVNAVLNVYLSRLRRLLADGTGEQLLLTQAAGYVLSVPPDQFDAHRFEALLEKGRRELASGEAERASLTLRDALALWRGPALADLAFEAFAQTEIARLEELRLAALEARIEADLVLGRQDSLVAELETLVAAHPYREGLRAQLMLALYRSGRQAEALETYRRARRTFSQELGIEPGPRLQELEGAILRHDSSLEAPGPEALRARDEERTEIVQERRRLPPRKTLALTAALGLVIAAAVVAAVRESSGRSGVPVQLTGEAVAVIDPRTDTIVGEIPVGGRPAGPAVGDSSVWVGNRDDNTLLRIDANSLDVVRTIGLSVGPTDVEVGAGSVWVLSDWALVRVDPAINDVVDTVPLPRGNGQRWSHMEVGANAVFVCTCGGGPGAVIRVDAATLSVEPVRRRPVWMIAYGEGALWALTGESDTIDRIDPKTSAVVESIPLGRIGEAGTGWRYRMAAGQGAIWVLAPASLWRIDSTTKRFVGSVPLGRSEEGSSVATGDGAIWVAKPEGILLRVDPDSQTVAKTIPLGTLVYPADLWDALAVGEGSVWLAVTSSAS
jgi:DNA-binding SARP family transcriptional activator/DNA-binding beta-propeller fold protein YncE